MKKLFVSAGLITVGVVAAKAVDAPGLSRMETAKWWSVSAALRGFYDDNYNTENSSVGDVRSSFGFELIPTIAANFPREQSYLGLSYQYDLRWYEDRVENEFDQSHQFVLKLDHRFSPRYSLKVEDIFTYSEEPALLEPSGVQTVTIRGDNSAIRNRADIDFTALLTEMLGIGIGYANTFYDYFDDEGIDGNGLNSRAAALNRLEHEFNLDGRYQLRESLIGVVGYRFGMVDYTSDLAIGQQLVIAPPVITFEPIPGSIRSGQTHTFYAGGEYTLSTKWTAEGRLGAQFASYDDLESNDSWAPYAAASARYQYLPGDYLQFGLSVDRNSTDETGNTLVTDLDQIVADQQTLRLSAAVTHRLAPRLTGNLFGSVQASQFEGGTSDGDLDMFYNVGLRFDYMFTHNWFFEAGYSFDRLDSDLDGRSFSRNRMFLGVRGAY